MRKALVSTFIGRAYFDGTFFVAGPGGGRQANMTLHVGPTSAWARQADSLPGSLLRVRELVWRQITVDRTSTPLPA